MALPSLGAVLVALSDTRLVAGDPAGQEGLEKTWPCRSRALGRCSGPEMCRQLVDPQHLLRQREIKKFEVNTSRNLSDREFSEYVEPHCRTDILFGTHPPSHIYVCWTDVHRGSRVPSTKVVDHLTPMLFNCTNTFENSENCKRTGLLSVGSIRCFSGSGPMLPLNEIHRGIIELQGQGSGK